MLMCYVRQKIVCRKYAVSISFHPMFKVQACKDYYHMNLICYCYCDGSCCQTSLLPIPKAKKSDEPAGSSLDHPEPLVSFALCCGSRSSPVVSPSYPLLHTLEAAGINTSIWLPPSSRLDKDKDYQYLVPIASVSTSEII